MAANPTPFVSVEEYWRQSATAERKHEYLDGRMWAMSGGSAAHAMLAFNLSYTLKSRLTGKNCTGASADLRVRTSPGGLYTYPDLSVVCGPMILDDDQKQTLTNPTLLVEVLSKSTESYDRGLKFDLYRQIESFRDMFLSRKNYRASKRISVCRIAVGSTRFSREWMRSACLKALMSSRLWPKFTKTSCFLTRQTRLNYLSTSASTSAST